MKYTSKNISNTSKIEAFENFEFLENFYRLTAEPSNIYR